LKKKFFFYIVRIFVEIIYVKNVFRNKINFIKDTFKEKIIFFKKNFNHFYIK
jgi:hypothetical protein